MWPCTWLSLILQYTEVVANDYVHVAYNIPNLNVNLPSLIDFLYVHPRIQ